MKLRLDLVAVTRPGEIVERASTKVYMSFYYIPLFSVSSFLCLARFLESGKG